jgi:hypothetical protein
MSEKYSGNKSNMEMINNKNNKYHGCDNNRVFGGT